MKKELALEQALERLDNIVTQLDDGGLPLDAALKLFEEGIALVRVCNGKMQDAQLKVEILSKELLIKREDTLV
ncbi:exodeoxyribonuclease VII small subunit [Hydrogenoanaerobacterium sp.]|uniref:exodeoxyribonuclease VII small subunit n=1 Tax=Hydrogenoanaerobacterium sp. TaxID=2953763 RepID=UPI00289E7163|nr:exodeoxyribonuclease VII small subunit [Hydrogenoanaerobacterium sp.]